MLPILAVGGAILAWPPAFLEGISYLPVSHTTTSSGVQLEGGGAVQLGQKGCWLGPQGPPSHVMGCDTGLALGRGSLCLLHLAWAGFFVVWFLLLLHPVHNGGAPF